MCFLKKWLSMLLSLVLVVSVLTIPAAATGGICGDDIGWSFDGSTLTLSGSGPMYDYVSDAFGHTNVPWGDVGDEIETVILAGPITHIGELAFYGCSKLKYINFPQSITSIGRSAFAYCKSLTGITLPEELTSIGYSAFVGCDNLKELTIPKGVTTIPGRCFESCDKLSRVVLPEGLTAIEHSAFQYCYKLEDVNIPSTLTSIGKEAFRSCYLPPILVLPDGITTIENKAFYSCSGLKEVTIPEGVTSIGNEAFRDCNGLKTLTIPDSVETIGTMAFWSCDSFTTLNIGSGIAAIGAEAFDLCKNLTDVYYNGTEEMWDRIDIGEENESLINAAIHFVEPEHVHVYTAEVTDPTCKLDGYITYICKCGDSYVEDGAAALGHSSVAYAVDMAPTLEAEGALASTCDRCGESLKVVLPKLNKQDYTVEVLVEPTKESEGFGKYTWNVTEYGEFSFEAAISNVVLGDVNDDGSVTILDLMRLANYFAKGAEINEGNADVNGDGNVTILDLMRLANYFAGKATLG